MTSRGYHMNRHMRRYGNSSNVNFRKHSGSLLSAEHEKDDSVISSSYLADDENYPSFKAQLAKLGLVLRDIPADGNCLFRALGDQLDGRSDLHDHTRQEVCDYIVHHRKDFEPFMEDDVPFETHIRNLRQLGTYGGNEVIVAFCRIHRVNVVIHQLGRDPWQICGTEDVRTGIKGANRRQLHIAYHNGDHYSSVRKDGDRTGIGSSIHIPFDLHNSHNSTLRSHGRHADSNSVRRLYDHYDGSLSKENDADWGDISSPYLRHHGKEVNNSNSNTLWAPGGTGTRIFGGCAGVPKPTGRPTVPRRVAKQVKKERATERRRIERLGVGAGESVQNDEYIVKGVHAIQI